MIETQAPVRETPARVSRRPVNRWSGVPALLALTFGACLTIAGCTSPGQPLGALPGLNGHGGSSAALSKAVKNDPFPTASQAGVASHP